MNSDSFFENEFFREHKGLITVLTTVSLAFFTIFWLYRGLKSNEEGQNNQNIQNNLNIDQINSQNMLNSLNSMRNKINSKRRLTISAQNILFTKINNIEMSKIYPQLDALAKNFDLFLIILINENDDTQTILEKLSVLFDDGIIFKHRVLFTTKLEGACAMIRSIDPYAHIESNQAIVINLIRFINEFWFVANKEIVTELEDKIKSDTNLSSTAPPLINKIKQFDSLNNMVKL